MRVPVRIQRKRTAGWRMPEGAVYVGRPTRWGNPFVVDSPFVAEAAGPLGLSDWREVAVRLHRAWIRGQVRIEPIRPWGPVIEFTQGSVGGTAWIEGVGVLDLPKVPDLRPLRGHDLACWCDLSSPCHADNLIAVANPGFNR